MKKTTIYANLEFYVYCPNCEETIEIEDYPEYPFTKTFCSNEWEGLSEEYSCPNCNKPFVIDKMET